MCGITRAYSRRAAWDHSPGAWSGSGAGSTRPSPPLDTWWPGKAPWTCRSARMIVGWAWDRQQPDVPVKVDIYDGKDRLATVAAYWYRRDLAEAGMGSGRHGYLYIPPARLKDGRRTRDPRAHLRHRPRSRWRSPAVRLFRSPGDPVAVTTNQPLSLVIVIPGLQRLPLRGAADSRARSHSPGACAPIEGAAGRRWIAGVADGRDCGPLQAIASVDVLRLRRNLGHQRAIAIGLAYVQANIPATPSW